MICGACLGASGPKTAIDEGTKTRILCLFAASKMFLVPTTLINSHNSGFSSPLAERIAAR